MEHMTFTFKITHKRNRIEELFIARHKTQLVAGEGETAITTSSKSVRPRLYPV
jgi:hypothetical protein